jgi:hypothetical protein
VTQCDPCLFCTGQTSALLCLWQQSMTSAEKSSTTPPQDKLPATIRSFQKLPFRVCNGGPGCGSAPPGTAAAHVTVASTLQPCSRGVQQVGGGSGCCQPVAHGPWGWWHHHGTGPCVVDSDVWRMQPSPRSQGAPRQQPTSKHLSQSCPPLLHSLSPSTACALGCMHCTPTAAPPCTRMPPHDIILAV